MIVGRCPFGAHCILVSSAGSAAAGRRWTSREHRGRGTCSASSGLHVLHIRSAGSMLEASTVAAVAARDAGKRHHAHHFLKTL